MKKIVCLFIAAAMLLPSAVFAETEFSDLGKDHWSYGFVSRLVEDKTVNGYEDGTFKPNAQVTRAEFVKMIGKSNERFSNDFADVPSTYWGYEYIMQSGMDISESNFRPDDIMTRNDVAALVWKRAGAKKGIKSAPNTTEGFTNKDAAAWVYTYGIMNGDDGIHLRPNDGITRAEAAAVICRARDINENSPTVNFCDKVSDSVLKTVFESSHLFDEDYSPEKTIKNGPLAKAGVRYIYDKPNPSYSSFILMPSFDGEYARDLYVMGHYLLGDDKTTAEFGDQTATVEDAVAFFTYCSVQKSVEPLGYGDKNAYYPEIKDEKMTEVKNAILTLAYNLGITIEANGKINAQKELTHKDMALILLQCDSAAGIYNNAYVSPAAETRRKAQISTDLEAYPKNKDDFNVIFADVPVKVYETPYIGAKGAPADGYPFTENYSGIFIRFVRSVCTAAQARSNINASAEFSPSMICKTDDGYAVRVKLTVTGAAQGLKLSDFAKLGSSVQDRDIKSGDVIYCDIHTGMEATDINIPVTNAYISQVIE